MEHTARVSAQARACSRRPTDSKGRRRERPSGRPFKATPTLSAAGAGNVRRRRASASHHASGARSPDRTAAPSVRCSRAALPSHVRLQLQEGRPTSPHPPLLLRPSSRASSSSEDQLRGPRAQRAPRSARHPDWPAPPMKERTRPLIFCHSRLRSGFSPASCCCQHRIE